MGIVFGLFVCCWLYQIIYQAFLMLVIIRHKEPSKKISTSKSVSIVICAKNEAENLRKNIPLILEQDYPDFELIIVNDSSEDTTKEVILEILRSDNRVSSLNITKEEKKGLGKKYALQKGVEHAKNELILLTDADCRPLTRNWIREMTAPVFSKKKIVLGVSPYEQRNTLLNGLIEFETCQTALQYNGYALLGMPYMGVGRNVCYDRTLLSSKNWNQTELSIASGDDDLTIQSLATKENTTICIARDGYTSSIAAESWKEWTRQKIRHYASGKLYKWKHRLCLGSYILTKTSLYCLLMILVISGYNVRETAYFYTGYVMSAVFLNLSLQIYLHLNSRWYLAPVFDFIYSITTPLFGYISQTKPREHWK